MVRGRSQIKFLCIFLSFSIYPFKDLDQAKKYSLKVPEYPEPENDNLDNPSYKNFYTKNNSFFKRLTLKKYFNHNNFINLLKNITECRKKYTNRNALIFNAVPQTNFIVINNIDGALHSFLRILDNLRKQKIINNNFKIIKENYYIIINGNSIDNSPFNFEVLDIILRFLKTNQDNFIYIKGPNEDKQRWRERPLLQALEVVWGKSKELLNLLTDFFNTLPLALYVTVQNNANTLRLSAYDPNFKELKLNYCSLASTEVEKFEICKIDDKTKEKIEPISIISIPTKNNLVQDFSGLKFEKDNFGYKSLWYLLSTPSIFYRQTYRFFYDAYLVINFGQSLNNTEIKFYQNNIKENTGFKLAGIYNLISGEKIT